MGRRPVGGFWGLWGSMTRGWQKAPAPGYMPEPLQGMSERNEV